MRWLSLLMLIPALALCIYIYFKDRVEKEPIALLAILFLVGAAFCVPLHLLEDLLMGWTDKLYSGMYKFSTVTGAREYVSVSAMLSHDSIVSFLAIALPEELAKWFAILIITRNSRHFNCLFDGIVYHVFYAFGFALAETVRFTVMNSIDMMWMKAFAVIPSYLLFGVVSGFFYTLLHCYSTARRMERDLIMQKVYTDKRVRIVPLIYALGLVVPTVVHGLCTLAEIIRTKNANFAYYCAVVLLYSACFIIVNRISKRDSENTKIAVRILNRLHKSVAADNGR